MKDELQYSRRLRLESLSMAMKMRETDCIVAAHTGTYPQSPKFTTLESVLEEAVTIETWLKNVDSETKMKKTKVKTRHA